MTVKVKTKPCFGRPLKNLTSSVKRLQEQEFGGMEEEKKGEQMLKSPRADKGEWRT